MTYPEQTDIKSYDLTRWQSAQQDLLKGRADRAIKIYQDLVKRYPASEKIWFELGLAAARELDFEQAQQAFDRTAELSDHDLSFQILLGQQYHLLRQMDRARACFERAAAIDPGSVHAQLSLVDWYERENRLENAWTCLQACAARHPHHPQVLCSMALLLQRRQQRPEAEQLLRQIIAADAGDLNVKYSSRHQLAVVLDQTGQPAEAVKWLLEAKNLLRQSANIGRLEQQYDQADRRRRQLLDGLTSDMIRDWQGQPLTGSDPGLRFAFLGGHPRSGTTLLEQILGTHPGVTAFDEPVAFSQEILDQLAPLENAQTLTASGLNLLGENRLASFRQRYRKSLGRELPTSALGERLLLDKNPSHTAAIHLWLRVFPKIKILIALRDPRDVVISCFFQNLKLNAVNANFLSLDRTVKHYSDLMDVWLRLRELGGFEWIETRYEDIVNNLAGEGRRVTEFLGLDWAPPQMEFHEAARHKPVFAPNYHEVVRPVYRTAMGRWRNYETALAPFQERLAPYCRAFGYE